MDKLAGTEVLPEPLGVGEQLEARFFRQVRALPPDTQELLLVLAAEPSGDPMLIRSAAELVGLADVAIMPAETAALVILGPPLAFRHPLMLAAVYQGPGHSDRRRSHATLASATAI